jgi:hypothetical protein
MNFWRSLINSKDKEADSLIVGGVVSLLTLCLAQLIALYLKQQFNATTFGAGCAAIIGATGTAKGVRDRLTPVGGDAPPHVPEPLSDEIVARKS